MTKRKIEVEVDPQHDEAILHVHAQYVVMHVIPDLALHYEVCLACLACEIDRLLRVRLDEMVGHDKDVSIGETKGNC